MSYEINHTDNLNYSSITVEDLTINQETSLSFVGKNYTGYSKAISENFLHLLENFANATPPDNPIVGQLWYDTNYTSAIPQPQLKLWDGISWAAAGNVKKAISRPLAANSIIGDIWVDTANQQLYLWSGANWILVGPQFSLGTQSGPRIDVLDDTLNTQHTVISMVVDDQIVLMFSKDAFTPKVVIDGFFSIKQGINVSTKDFDGDGEVLNKLWGTAEKADALVIGNSVVASTNFLRSDTTSVTNFGLNIRSNSGLTLGTDLSTSLNNTISGETILYNKIEGSRIFLRVNRNGAVNDTLTISGNTVGINKPNPTQALDIAGNLQVDTGIIITGTANTTSMETGSIRTAGGVSIAKDLLIGQHLIVAGTSTLNSVLPDTSGASDLGSVAKSWRNVYATSVTASNFYGSFSGQLSGSVTGSASKLTSPTIFQLTGDISSNQVSFNGQQLDGTATFSTILSQDFINTKTEATTSIITDELLINRVGTGLRKLSKNTFLANVATVPAGVIMPFAGTVVPSGYLLCDGSEQRIAVYPELFAVVGYAYKAAGLLLGVSTFAIPDLRGRFPLGRDSMNNGTTVTAIAGGSEINTITGPADRVTDVTADIIGLGNGDEQINVAVDNLPQHKHDMRGTTTSGSKGNQFYAMRNTADPISDIDVVSHTANGPSAADTAQYLTNSGGILTAGNVGVPISVMNPYTTLNYIIFTGKVL